jgi:proteasome beta subunit
VTLVLALRCRDGVVLASDGQSTADTLGQPTRQPTRKLFDIGGRIAWGAAGSVGLQQTLRGELDRIDDRAGGPGELRRRLAGAVIPIQQGALDHYVPHRGTDPPELACVFCWCDEGGPRILEVPRTGGDHQFHERYSAIGSGEIFAKFAMVSIAHLDTPELSLEQGKVVAYKAIADAIAVAAVFLGPPIQMYVVTAAGAERVPADELAGGISDSVDTWKARQREALGPLAPDDRARPAAAASASATLARSEGRAAVALYE